MNKSTHFLVPLLFCIVLFTFSACGEKLEETSFNIVVSTKDDTFELKMYLDKGTYRSDEVISCYATLEYVGEEDSITIYHSDPLIGFALKDNRYFDGGYFTNDVLLTTTLNKGEIMRVDFIKSGGWASDNPNADFYEKFYAEQDLILPVGRYKIAASVTCSFDGNDIIGSKYNKSVSEHIKVIK